MGFNDCWNTQGELVEKIVQITTRILPEGDGVALRFINRNVNNSEKLSLQQIVSIMKGATCRYNSTPIGTSLRYKILEPLVYSQLRSNTFVRPLLISVITDGAPNSEKKEAFVDAIKECGGRLEQAGYPRASE